MLLLYDILKTVHVLSVIIWVGGMFFTHFILRPAVVELDLETRLRLMQGVLRRFFSVVLAVSLLSLASGIWMLGRVAKQTVQAGAGFNMPLAWTIMAVLGVVMVATFFHIRFALFKRFNRYVGGSEWESAGLALAKIRRWVFINLLLGVVIVVVTLLS